VLRPGNASAKAGAIGILKRLLARVREAFPQARIRVRLDGGFAGPELLTFLDAQPNVVYVVAMAKNDVLTRLAEPAMRKARALSKATGRTAHVYGEGRYAAGSWQGVQRRVIFKAEVGAARNTIHPVGGRPTRRLARFAPVALPGVLRR